MNIATIQSNFFGIYENQKDLANKVKDWVKNNLIGRKIYVASCNKTIDLNWQGLKNDLGEYHYPLYIEKLISFGILDEIIANADYLKEEKDKRDRLSIKAVHRLSSRVQIDNKVYDVVIICIESSANFIYDHILLE